MDVGKGTRTEEGSKKSMSSLFRRLLETDLDRKDRTTKIFQFVFPWLLWIVVGAITVILLTAWMGWGIGKELLNIWIFYTLPPAGKETLIPTAVSKGVPGYFAGFSTSIIDICFSLFLIWNYDWVKKLPVLGPALSKTERKGKEKVKRTRWFGRATFLLTTFVVFVPFSGSGGVGGTVFGRIVGLGPYRVLAAVFIGSFIGSTGFAFLSEQLTDFLGADNPFVYFLSNLNILQLVAALVAVGFVIYVIRNPRMAAIKTTRAVARALDMTEKALDIAERKREQAANSAMKGARESFRLMRDGNRMVTDMGLEIATKPMEVLGEKGRKMKRRTKDFSMRQVDHLHRMAGGTVDRTMELGERVTSSSIHTAAELTRKGLRETIYGWDEAGKIIVKGGENIEKLYPKRKKETEEKLPSSEEEV